MAWVYLILAGFFETAWAVGLKYTEGWTKLVPSIITIALMAVSFILLSLALKELPIGTAYAVWTGIGTIGTVIFGMIYFKEPSDILRILCILLIVAGIVGLKLLHGK